jgi:MFS family permease
MRGVATATFFLATTLVGLALGPFLAGWVSAQHGGNISLGVRSILWAAPIGFVCLVAAIRLVPEAVRTLRATAEGAGEASISRA